MDNSHENRTQVFYEEDCKYQWYFSLYLNVPINLQKNFVDAKWFNLTKQTCVSTTKTYQYIFIDIDKFYAIIDESFVLVDKYYILQCEVKNWLSMQIRPLTYLLNLRWSSFDYKLLYI